MPPINDQSSAATVRSESPVIDQNPDWPVPVVIAMEFQQLNPNFKGVF